MTSSSRSSNSRVNSFHNQPSPRPECIAMARQVYLAHQITLPQGEFFDVGMRTHCSIRQVVSAGVNACKANIIPRTSETSLPESSSSLPVPEKAPKIPPSRPARDSGEFGVIDERTRAGSPGGDKTAILEPSAGSKSTRAQLEYRENGSF
ncbi:hypothetical protein DOTSEDRAFT_33353 [Dothistroma septosporum NZE10]|uniref:Uncharacterized protein n=1 Tax=Dothistroma septosporum (strain NZE10 / CBS 128990) TaxID=675120 RepID=N1PV30_DOTSN|nr:hypothetical protein DOTSEDRAFT_33353 [Dothistroma septosporum NZE10]